jgi:type IV fimbrial biogenesis protein FimT
MKRQLRGFSIPELLMGLSITAVVAGMAVPSLQGMARNARVTAAHNDLLSALGYARGQAVRRAAPVALCATVDLAHCSESSDWTSGWIAFTDAAGEPGVLDRNDELLRVWQGHGPDVSVHGAAATGPEWVRFSAAGQSLPVRLPRQLEVEPAPCAGDGSHRLLIVVEPAGSIRHERASCT